MFLASTPPVDPLLEFLSTPSDVIPAAIAAAALLLGIVNLIRSFLTPRKPLLRVRAEVEHEEKPWVDDDGNLIDLSPVSVSLRNRGEATAHDIRITIKPRNGNKWTREVAAIEPDGKLRVEMSVLAAGDPTGKVVVRYKRGPLCGVREVYGWAEP